jgi:hypothetical protein
VNTDDREVQESLSGKGVALYDLRPQKNDVKGWDGVYVTKEMDIKASRV